MTKKRSAASRAASLLGRRGGRPRLSEGEKAARGVTVRPRGRPPKAPPVDVQADPEATPYAPAMRDKYLSDIREIPGFDPYRDAGECVFDAPAAHTACEFFRCRLRHVKGELARQHFELRPWQRGIIAALFGWKRPDETRRFREAFIYVPKKNGKTFLVAGIVVYMLAEDPEEGQENYSAAASRDQASLVFHYAAGMVRQSRYLSEKIRVFGDSGGSNLKSLLADRDGIRSVYKALAAGANRADGANVHLAVIDELHRHPDGELADILQKSTAARRNPMVISTTTADYDRPESPCNRKLAYARQVLDGSVRDAAFLPVVYAADLKDDWTKPEIWKKANPNYGVTVPEDFFIREVEKAKNDPTTRNDFLRLHLNIVTEQSVIWLPVEAWDACSGLGAETALAWRERQLRELAGKPCLSGLDLGSTSDLTAFCLRFATPDAVILLPWFWMPREGIRKKAPEFANLYETWIEQGFVRGTSGNVCDYDLVRADIKALKAKFDIREIACDPWNGMQLMTQLMGDGFAVVQFRQGFASLAGPTKMFGERVLSKRLTHGGNPVLRWMASNTQVERDAAGNTKPTKGRDSQRKIDGIVAAIMAEGRSMVATDTRSVYSGGGGLKSL